MTDAIDYPALNAATASVTLLYYHLLEEGGITHDQTVYIDPNDFDPTRYLDFASDRQIDIDPSLLREGALVHLLCNLNDTIEEFEDDYLAHPFARTIIDTLNSCSWLPNSIRIMLTHVAKPLRTPEDFELYDRMLQDAYLGFVVARYRRLLGDDA